jgi:hypothetical protein
MQARNTSTPKEMKNALFSSTIVENPGFSIALCPTSSICV